MSLGLSMIVKNEAHVIGRCIASVRPIINHWTIVDTGSTDGTQRVIKDLLKDVPGELIESPWHDFATNRNEALELARPHNEYVLVIDADDALEYEPGFRMPKLSADAYELRIKDGGSIYARTQIVRSAKPWHWRGVVHEFLDCPGGQNGGVVPGLALRRNHDGARRRSPETYKGDVAVLEAALEMESDTFMRSRYTFYLAQSYRDCGEKEQAVRNYLARADMGFWNEEVYVSLRSAGWLMNELGRSIDEIVPILERASSICPWRAEALHTAAFICRLRGHNREGYEIAKRGLELQVPDAGLFIEPWIYEYGLLDEYAINGYWASAYVEAAEACIKLLSENKLPESQRERVAANAKFAVSKFPRLPELGSLGKEDFTHQHALVSERPLHSRLTRHPRVLIAILAKQKEEALPLYLDCIEALDYPKSSVALYIRTNNNTDGTAQILRDWIARLGHQYAAVELDDTDVPDRVEEFGVHEWNSIRFRVLARIRNISLGKVREYGCEYYFTADVDNFIRPCVLRELIALDLPIVSPLLRSINPNAFYSNYHAEVDADGYYQGCDQYEWVLQRRVRGLIEMPVVHCTYLLRADVLPNLKYEDATQRHEYVVFAASARQAGIPQYLDNRQVYGYITFGKDETSQYVEDGVCRARELLQADLQAARVRQDGDR